ncbi:MAG: helix-turn-helix domain-containing protein [Vulcanimicrobiaceae bacterium]
MEYRTPGEWFDALRAKIKAIGIRTAARISGVSRAKIQAIVNHGASPHRSTIEKLEAALQRPGTRR